MLCVVCCVLCVVCSNIHCVCVCVYFMCGSHTIGLGVGERTKAVVIFLPSGVPKLVMGNMCTCILFIFIRMCMCVYMCVYMCVCVCVCTPRLIGFPSSIAFAD